MIRLFFILIVLIVSSFVNAVNKTYGVAHIGITKTNTDSKLQIYNRSSYIGLKGVSALNSKLYATYKFEIGVDFTNHSLKHSPSIHYSFIGLKSKFGELRLGLQDSAYDIVDNSMENFLTEQGNGLITENEPAELIAFIKRFGLFGLYSSHIPSSETNKASSSIMLNYASRPFYLGLGVIKEAGKGKKEGAKLVATYQKNNIRLGFIHEKCPSGQNIVAAVKGDCTGSGKAHINHVSAAYSFGRSYIAGQLARNSYSSIDKYTVEVGTTLGQKSKVYIEFDKVGSSRATTVGLKTYF